MKNLKKLYNHPFVIKIIDDSKKFDSQEKLNKYADTELEFYINNSMFYKVHLISLFEQLENAIELFSNYNYSQKSDDGRGKHLTYNYENYIIRLVSISDRLLQVINAVFYLGINEKDVKERSILNNDKIVITDLPNKYKELKKVLAIYVGDRNKVIHRHSHVEKKLVQIEMFYHPEITKSYFENSQENEISQFKSIRKYALTDFIKKTKDNFRETNKSCLEKLYPILDELHLEYNRIKGRLN